MTAFGRVYTLQDFYNMLGSDNSYYTSPDGEEAFGSLRDYFYNMSNSAYRPTIEILNNTGRYMMPHTKEYYIGLGEPASFDPLTNDAIALAQADGKNVTTNANRRICVIYAGNRRTGIGAWAYQGGARYIAFERWKYTDQYGYTREYADAPFTHIGVHAHEFAHLRNLAHPTSNRWSLLGDGQKNGPGPSFGACPAPLNPWFRSLDNWVTITTITGDINNANLVYNGTPNNYKINLTRSDGKTESFLVENRQFTSGFDRHLPGANGGTGGPGGLLIWDIYQNNYWSHNYVDLIEADNTPVNDAASLPTDIFRPDGDYPYNKIFDYSSPATLKFRNGTLSHFAVENYTSNGNTITVNFKTSYLTSNTSSATAYNNGRKLLRDSNGKYHLVYETEGEIYYQYSNDGGSTWAGYKRLSTGNGNNKYPSITGTSSKQFVVWQRYTGYSGGQHKYDTYFAKNTGSGWTTTTITNLSNLAFSTQTDPLPVVTYKNPSAPQRLLVCAKTSSGIKYVTSDTDGSSWSIANSLPYPSSSHKNPSLSMGPTTPASTVYATYDNNSSITLNPYYTTMWELGQNVSLGSGTSNNQYASVEVDGSAGKIVAWQAKKISNNKQVICYKRNTGTNWNFLPTFFEPGANNKYHRPSITGHTTTKCAIVYHDDYGVIYRSYFNGASWSTLATADTYLQHPNLSAGTTTAKYVFTGGSASPYQIYLSNETLPLGGMAKPMLASVEEEHLKMLPCPQRHHRAAMVADTTSASLLWLQWGDIIIKTKNDSDVSMSFVVLPDSMPQVTAETVFSYLTTASLILPADSDSLEWQQELYGCKLPQLVTSGTFDLVVEIQLVSAKTGLPLAVLNRAILSVSLAEHRLAGTVVSDISAYQGREVRLKVNVIAIAQNIPDITSSVGEIFIIDNPFVTISQPKAQPPVANKTSLPLAYQLKQNYPNPFNAATMIGYQLAEADRVILNIYNLLGQQVRTLVDKDQAAGYHTVQWDGKATDGQDLASGIYVYQIKVGSFVASKKLVLIR